MVIFVSLEMHPKSRTHGLVSIGHDKSIYLLKDKII